MVWSPYVVAILDGHAAENSTPSIAVTMSMRLGARRPVGHRVGREERNRLRTPNQ